MTVLQPVAVYDVYFKQIEWLQNRGDVEGYNTDVFSKAFRRATLTSAPLYNTVTNIKVEEYTSAFNQIQSLDENYTNVLSQGLINITDKLVIPNVSSGYIYIKTIHLMIK